MLEGLSVVLRRYREAFAAAWSGRREQRAVHRGQKEAEFLPALLEVQESPPPPKARLVAWLIIVFFLVAVLWMTLGKLDIVVAAPGKIIPDSRIKVAQAAAGGVVSRILVRDGARVSAGELLFELDNTAAAADLAVVEDAMHSAMLEREMTFLLASGQVPAAGLFVPDVPAARVERQRELMRVLNRERQEREAQIQREIDALRSERRLERQGALDAEERLERERELSRVHEDAQALQVEKLKALVPLVEEEHESLRILHEDEVVSLFRLRQAEEKLIALRADLEQGWQALRSMPAAAVREVAWKHTAQSHRDRLSSLDARLAAREQSLVLARSEFVRQMYDRHEQAQQEVARLRHELSKLRQQRARHRVVAPLSGVVQQLAVHTQGAVVQEGQALLVIVPERPVLEIEAMVENKDIGFLSEGQQVQVKIDAFSYTKYGLVGGEVAHLSPDAINDEQRGLVYLARVRLENDSIVVEGEEKRLTSGMSVVVEIKTGERRVIEYFLAPLLRHGNESLGER